jgi:hypothetical protein
MFCGWKIAPIIGIWWNIHNSQAKVVGNRSVVKVARPGISVFRDVPVLRVQVDAHDPFAIDVVGLEEVFQGGLIGRFNFRQHPAPNLAGETTPDFHFFTVHQYSHEFS